MSISPGTPFSDPFQTARFITASLNNQDTPTPEETLLPESIPPTTEATKPVEVNDLLLTLGQALLQQLLTPQPGPQAPTEADPQGPGKSSMAPGQRAKAEGGSARDYAPGQLKKQPPPPPPEQIQA